MIKARTTLAACAGLAVVLLAAPAAAETPKLDRKSYVDEQNGYSFKPPADWEATPVLPQLKAMGMLHRMDGGPRGTRELVVFKLDPGKDGGERPDLAKRLESTFGQAGFDREAIQEDEQETIGGLSARHRLWKGKELLIDTWVFQLAEFDVALVYLVEDGDKDTPRWLQLFRRSARTFTTVERSAGLTVSNESSYEEQLAFHSEDAARTPGWRALPTPTRKFIIKTSHDDDGFIKEVIERLELSREVYEQDFPPAEDFDHVSVVRICKTEEEFHRYGLTGGGVAGWFNPGTTELVLFDALNTDRNGTYAVMSHEAFHQYCHFLFGQSEAHRWFDEGHGDYYGGAEFKRGRATITPRMPGGLDRLTVIREMIREETYAPIKRHLNFNHQEWQGQGPSNVSCYAQSWSIVYMLRQGTLGKVPRKCWRDEYAEIIPSYVRTLYEGYQQAYEEQRKERLKEAEEEAGEGSSVVAGQRRPLGPEKKEEIWKKAIDASWGRIDLDQFEQDWVRYVTKDLK